MHATRLVQSELTHLRGDRTRPPLFPFLFCFLGFSLRGLSTNHQSSTSRHPNYGDSLKNTREMQRTGGQHMTASITVRTVQVLPATRWRRTQLGVQCTLPDRQIPNKINTYLYLKREKKKKKKVQLSSGSQ